MCNDVELAFIIVNWNTRELLRSCLASVEDTCAKFRLRSVEVIVVDNASTDGSVALIQSEFSNVRLICNKTNLGFAGANNQAMQICRASWILLLNSDAEMSAAALEKLLASGKTFAQAGILGCKLVNPDGSFQAAYNSFPNPATALLEAWGLMGVVTRNRFYPSAPPARARQTKTCDWVGGACLLVRRRAIDDVGFLDESFFMNCEEIDWCYRMWRHGWQVWYVAEAEVVHVGGASADRRSARQRMRLYEGKVRFVRKHYGRVAGGALRFTFRMASLSKAIGYELVFLLTRKPKMRAQAASHWPVTWSKVWA